MEESANFNQNNRLEAACLPLCSIRTLICSTFMVWSVTAYTNHYDQLGQSDLTTTGVLISKAS